MAKPAGLSGFPEWLPEGRLVELEVLDTARRVFELHGFVPLETRSVEPLDVLLRKGEIDKEVYGVRRLQGEEQAGGDLALHFDLTVPFARYVVENAGRLAFPFRRYQIQKVWRGERPQEGRFREFTQADIDIVDVGTLSAHHEAEIAQVMAEVFARLPIPPAVILVNNRKILEGFYRGIGVSDTAAVLRTIDKLDKIGAEKVRRLLMDEAGLDETAADLCLRLAEIRTPDSSFAERVRDLGVSDPLLEEGLGELAAVVDAAGGGDGRVSIVADLHIARGLDYYTGTVYETYLQGFESFGSICSGGRYDSLASDGTTTYPGVGISLGVTRLVSLLLGRDLVTVSRSVPAAVLVAVVDEDARSRSDAVARRLRERGIACEVAPRADKFGKQIRYADRRGIPFVWFPGIDDADADTVKDIRTGDQVPADAGTWSPPDTDARPRIAAAAHEGAS